MLTTHTKKNIATITLNRPEAHNAFDDKLIKQFTDTLCDINENKNIKVVLLNAIGKHFCAGADINWMRSTTKYLHEENIQDAYALANLLRTLNTLNKPTIALIQGSAFGGGIGFIAACDIAIAVPDAQFGFSEVKNWFNTSSYKSLLHCCNR